MIDGLVDLGARDGQRQGQAPHRVRTADAIDVKPEFEAAQASRAIRSCAGSRVSRSATISMPCSRPRPRRSPMAACRACSSPTRRQVVARLVGAAGQRLADDDLDHRQADAGGQRIGAAKCSARTRARGRCRQCRRRRSVPTGVSRRPASSIASTGPAPRHSARRRTSPRCA